MKWTIKKYALHKWMIEHDWSSGGIAIQVVFEEDRMEKLLAGAHWYARERLAILALTGMKTLDLFDCENTGKNTTWAILTAAGDLLSQYCYEPVFIERNGRLESAGYDRCRSCKMPHTEPHMDHCPLVNLLDAIDSPMMMASYCPACEGPSIPGAMPNYDGCMQEEMGD